jgi:hypothetical protein
MRKRHENSSRLKTRKPSSKQSKVKSAMEELPRKVKTLCVFCGSSDGVSPVYKEAATRLGKEIVKHGWNLVSVSFEKAFW